MKRDANENLSGILSTTPLSLTAKTMSTVVRHGGCEGNVGRRYDSCLSVDETIVRVSVYGGGLYAYSLCVCELKRGGVGCWTRAQHPIHHCDERRSVRMTGSPFN